MVTMAKAMLFMGQDTGYCRGGEANGNSCGVGIGEGFSCGVGTAEGFISGVGIGEGFICGVGTGTGTKFCGLTSVDEGELETAGS